MLLKVASASFSCLSDSPCLLYPFIRDGRRGCLHVLVTVKKCIWERRGASGPQSCEAALPRAWVPTTVGVYSLRDYGNLVNPVNG